MSLDPEVRQLIEDVLRNNRVVLFMKGHRHQPQCGFSAKTVSALDLLLPDYLHVNVLDHPEIREGIKAYGNWPTIPQLYVAGELVGGSDIVLEMMESGELAEVLGVEKPQAGAPRIDVEEAAAGVMQGAVQQRPGIGVHLRIDASWQHVLSLGPVAPGELRVTAGGVDLYMDEWSAARADGLRVGVEEALQGTRFRFDNPNAPPPVQQMTVRTLKGKLDAGEKLELVDVRGPDERAVALIPQARAWDEQTDRYLDGLPKDALVVFLCHKGGRSQNAAEYLRRKGFTNVHNLAGGIDAWSQEIDPSVARY
jgi:monothiol glutaredoxin